MRSKRRDLLAGAGLAVASTAVGCAPRAAPAVARGSSREVVQLVPGLPTMEGAGVQLTRILGQPALRNLDPFILLDRVHTSEPAAYVRGFPDHPHRGFETVTIMLEGRFRHADSRGNQGIITGGGAQWMTAARGIVHSEMPAQSEGLLSAFQLWVNLPAREKMSTPAYQDLAPERIARAPLDREGSALRVIAGNVNGLAGPVRQRPTEPQLLVLTLANDRPFELDVPVEHTAFVCVHEGAVHVGPDDRATRVGESQLGVLSPGKRLRLRARERRSTLLVAAGRPLREPIVQRGPFVMNSAAEIEQAFADYRAGVLDRG